MILEGLTAAGDGSAAATAYAFDQAFWWSIGFTAVAIVVSLTLPGRPRPVLEPAGAGVDHPADPSAHTTTG